MPDRLRPYWSMLVKLCVLCIARTYTTSFVLKVEGTDVHDAVSDEYRACAYAPRSKT